MRVLVDSEKYFRVLTELFEIDILKQNTLIDNKELKVKK